jgi:septal ring factor EnvC (AmiA/AmiB activator)
MEAVVVQSIRFWGLIAMLMFLPGCTIMAEVEKNKETVVRIENKEKELKELQGGIQKKKEMNEKLLSQLQIQLQELEKHLKEYDEVKKGSKDYRSDIASLKRRLDDLDNQLSQLKKELAYGSGGQDEKKIGEKKRQIE